MSHRNIPYTNFNKYVLRTPLFPVDFYTAITRNEVIEEDKLKELCTDKSIQEALFLASPDLFSEISKWLDYKVKTEDSKKLQHSIIKYISRMSSRCTPFGLFAGTTVGEFSNTTEIELKKHTAHKRHTRLDMNYLVALTQNIIQIESIRNQLKFRPNTSLYKIGEQLRYIEYTYINARRTHHIVGVKNSWYLNNIIEAAKTGKTIEELAQFIISEDITFEEAFLFIIELVENQVLISELEPSVSGAELLDHIINVISTLKHTDTILSILENVKLRLLKIDESLANDISEYFNIGELLKPLNTDFQLKYLFQTDMITATNKNTLDNSIIKKIKSVFNLLNKISLPQTENGISKFNKAFYERYETKPVSLSKALDRELGIGFTQDNNYGDVNLLIDDLNLPPRKNASKRFTIKTSVVQEILQRNVIKCIQNNNSVLILDDDDFKDLDTNWNDLPDTMSSMLELVNINGEEKIILDHLGGTSATNLLGRFGHGDKNLNTFIKEIAKIEQTINSDKILAEIVHLPESRAGNIIFRPHIREYEIPYLANSTVSDSNQLNIEDLELVSNSPNKLFIKSKKHNKEVIPRLSNAHNYNNGALPVYEFLASAQNLNKRMGIGFSWGALENEFDFLPRVEYKGVILSSKLWKIKKEDIKPLIETIENNFKLKEAINVFLAKQKLPTLVMLKDGDNELLINFNNLSSVRMFLDTIKKRKEFKLKEFLQANNNIVKEGSNSFSNQFILSFFNEEKLNQFK